MRPTVNFTLHAALATALIALAATSAAADEVRTYTGGRFSMDISGRNDGYLSRFGAPGSDPEQIEVESWSWGATQPLGGRAGNELPPPCGCRGCCSAPGEKIAAIPFEYDVKSPRDVATGQATGKRQHKPMTITKEWGARPDLGLSPLPPQPGSLRIKVKMPWLACRVGATYPVIRLTGEGKAYRFEETVITGCAGESVALDYAKVTVRGWDPGKKEE